MTTEIKLTNPWMVAVWPGMGHVAISAGYYLLSKLEMHFFAELSPRQLFDVEAVEVKDGLIQVGRMPRSRFFVWKDPSEKHDIVVFIGEAQPPIGKYAFCHNLVEFARQLGVERLFTFAAMATEMHPEHPSRVFAAATSAPLLTELRQQHLETLNDGNIGGMNGVVLGIAAEKGLPGACLLGEMPHIFAQFPFPKAALAVLQIFANIADISIDFSELSMQAEAVEEKLGELLAQVQSQLDEQREPDEEFQSEPEENEGLSQADQQQIDKLFEQAQQDRSKAYELKRELDRLEVFKNYEDRFLDLFKPPTKSE